MKISYFLLFFGILLFPYQDIFSQSAISESQCTKGSAEYTLRYNKLKAMYVELQNKETTKEYLALQRAFKEKANYEGGAREIVDKGKKGIDAVHEWARNNVEKTDFKNREEVEAEISKILALNWQIIGENRELYSYLSETSDICKDLPVDLILELLKEYGENLRL